MRLDMGQREKNAHLLYVVPLLIGDSTPAGKGEKKEFETFAKTSDIGWKKRTSDERDIIIPPRDVVDHQEVYRSSDSTIHSQLHPSTSNASSTPNHNTAQQSFNRTSRLLP